MVYGGIFDFDKKKTTKEIELEFEDQYLGRSNKSKGLNHERRSLEKVVFNLESIEKDLGNTQELLELASSENDDFVIGEIAVEAEQIEEKISKIEFSKMFSNESDPLNCFVDFQAGLVVLRL